MNKSIEKTFKPNTINLKEYLSGSFYGYEDIDTWRMCAVNLAMSTTGKIKYKWGGKPQSTIYDNEWEKDSGLDCSGFINWVYWSILGDEYKGMMSTAIVSSEKYTKEIEHSKLQPGDLGTLNNKGTVYLNALGEEFPTYEEAEESNNKILNNLKELLKEEGIKYSEEELNLLAKEQLGVSLKDFTVTTSASHVGIYVGKDENGSDIWCHCSGSAQTVVVDNFKFKYFYRVK